jgi:hypothetical protein
MKSKRIFVSLIVLLLILLPTLSVAAAGEITLDGNFDDWTDKPSLADKQGDETPSRDLISVKWFPDISSGNLYFYAERLSGEDDSKHKSFDDWELNLYIKGDLGLRKLKLDFHPPSHFVDSTLTDEQGLYLWSEKGKWGDDKEPGTRIEFRVPFEYIESSTTSGYQVSAYFESEEDRVPDNGGISISTISTFPIQNLTGVVIVCVALFLIFKRRIQKSRLNKKTFQCEG